MTNNKVPGVFLSTRLIAKRSKVSKTTFISPGITTALDRSNITNRNAAFLLTAAAQTYVQSDVTCRTLSTSSISRFRGQNRAKHLTQTKSAFLCEDPLVVHFDGKLLPSISDGPGKENEVAVVVSGHEVEKLLGIPKIAKWYWKSGVTGCC